MNRSLKQISRAGSRLQSEPEGGSDFSRSALARHALLAALAFSTAACQTAAPPQDQPLALASAPAVVAPGPAQPVSPDRLIGLNEAEILGFFGLPSLKRKEAPAELWQYAAPGCIMDLYLYSEGGTRKVSYASLRDPASGRVGGTACQGQLAKLGPH